MLKKLDCLVNKFNSRCQNNIFKFGVEVPLTVEDALRIDQENGNTLWHDYIGKETNSSRIIFDLIDKYNYVPVGYKEIILVPSQDIHFFYTRSHLSAQKRCALISATNFQFIFITGAR